MIMDISNYIKQSFERDFGPIQTPTTTELKVDVVSNPDEPKVVEASRSKKWNKDLETIEEWRDRDKERRERVETKLEERRINLSRPIPQLEPVVCFDGVPICHKHNCSFITGGEGSKKTMLLTAIAIAHLKGVEGFQGFNGNNEPRKCVYWVDTEQNPEDYAVIAQRVQRGLGLPEEGVDNPNFNIVGFDEVDIDKMMGDLEDDIWYYQPTLVIIDGIVDFSPSGGMDSTEAQSTLRNLRLLAKRNDTHIMTVIHTNQGTDKSRGWYGGEALRKFETAIISHLDPDSEDGVSGCSWKKTRRAKPDDFTIWYNTETNLPEIAPTKSRTSKNTTDKIPITSKMSAKDNRARMCQELFSNADGIVAKDFYKMVEDFYKCNNDNAKTIAEECKQMGLIKRPRDGKFYLAERSQDE